MGIILTRFLSCLAVIAGQIYWTSWCLAEDQFSVSGVHSNFATRTGLDALRARGNASRFHQFEYGDLSAPGWNGQSYDPGDYLESLSLRKPIGGTDYCGTSICNEPPVPPIPPGLGDSKKPKLLRSTSVINFETSLFAANVTAANTFQRYYFPTTVALMKQEQLMCSGVLIGKTHIATAAHCVCNAKLTDALFGSTIYPGPVSETGLVQKRSLKAGYASVSSEFCKAYNDAEARKKDDFWHHGDLAVVTLASPFDVSHLTFSTDIVNADVVPATYYIVGFGAHESLWRGGVKRMAVVTPQPCTKERSAKTGCVTGTELISTSKPGALNDSCRGDSGGALYVEDAKTNKLFLAGIISRATKGRTLICGEGGIYVSFKEGKTHEWIKKYN